jgi:hypothetical protein
MKLSNVLNTLRNNESNLAEQYINSRKDVISLNCLVYQIGAINTAAAKKAIKLAETRVKYMEIANTVDLLN